MKASVILAGLSAMMATAAPVLEDRAIYTEVVKKVVHVTKTAYVTGPGATDVVVQEAPKEPEVVVKTVVHNVQYKPAPSPVYVPPVEEKPKEEKPKVVYTTVVAKPKAATKAAKPKTTKTSTTAKPSATKETVVEETKQESTASGIISLTSNSYETIMLHYHNIHRANHSAPALVWDDALASYAEETSKKCKLEHDFTPGGGGYGQNLAYWSTTADDLDSKKNWCAASGITNQWYNSEMDNWSSYGQANPPSNQPINDYGHFTQLVWKHSTKVGCATVYCGTGFAYPAWFTTCNYDPVGNVGGQYGDNVLAPKKEKRVTL